MSADREEQRDDFLRRWSRLKKEARDSSVAPVSTVPTGRDAEEAPPQLPPIHELTIDSDFSGFFHPKVGEDLRRSALRKLFSDPHFNVMDGLDTYVDDYSKTEPIPAATLAGLKQAQRIIDWASNKDEEVPAEAAEDAIAENPAEVRAVSEAQPADTPQVSGQEAQPISASKE